MGHGGSEHAQEPHSLKAQNDRHGKCCGSTESHGKQTCKV